MEAIAKDEHETRFQTHVFRVNCDHKKHGTLARSLMDLEVATPENLVGQHESLPAERNFCNNTSVYMLHLCQIQTTE